MKRQQRGAVQAFSCGKGTARLSPAPSKPRECLITEKGSNPTQMDEELIMAFMISPS